MEIVSNTGGNAQVWTFDNTGVLTAPGNITAPNFIGVGANTDIVAGDYTWTFDNTGNLSAPGNITGTQSNITLLAGSYTWTMDNTGNLTAPGMMNFNAGNLFVGNLGFNNGPDLSATANGGNIFLNAVHPVNGAKTWQLLRTGEMVLPGPAQLAVYANATVRDSSITSPTPGMMIYVTGVGMQVRGATSWNTIAGSGT